MVKIENMNIQYYQACTKPQHLLGWWCLCMQQTVFFYRNGNNKQVFFVKQYAVCKANMRPYAVQTVQVGLYAVRKTKIRLFAVRKG